MGTAFRPAAQQAVANVFALYAEFVVTGYYFRAGSNLATIHFLVKPVPANRVDGTTVQPNDERLLVDATELAGVDQPRPGDYVVQEGDGLRRDVVTAHLDVTAALWRLVGRKVW